MPIALLIMQLLPVFFELIKRAPETIDSIKEVIDAMQALPPEVQAQCVACLKTEESHHA